MSKDSLAQKNKYNLSADEKLGFVFPIYWYNMPMMVEEFVRNLEIEGYESQYVYAVVTYGNSAGGTLNALNKIIQTKGISLMGEFGVTMVDNYVIAYDLENEDKQAQILANANQEFEAFIDSIKNSVSDRKIKIGPMPFTSTILKPFYVNANHTKKFFATDDCVGCKQCEIECPCNVIKVENQKPQWDGNCSFCLKCIHHCPKKAIQYGKKTAQRRRYYLSTPA